MPEINIWHSTRRAGTRLLSLGFLSGSVSACCTWIHAQAAWRVSSAQHLAQWQARCRLPLALGAHPMWQRVIFPIKLRVLKFSHKIKLLFHRPGREAKECWSFTGLKDLLGWPDWSFLFFTVNHVQSFTHGLNSPRLFPLIFSLHTSGPWHYRPQWKHRAEVLTYTWFFRLIKSNSSSFTSGLL